MESGSDGSSLQRTPSAASTVSHRSGTVRIRPRKHSSAASQPPATTPKSLTSFPSLSPDNSPQNAAERKARAVHSPATAEPGTPGRAKAAKEKKTKPSIVEALTANSPSFRGRSALFEDSPTSATQKVPGALHHASDEHIKALLARKGAVAFVRQLAEDLAQRDAEITTVRRRAEARERELKKMLHEVEVSHLDIEKRLHHLDYATGIGIDMPSLLTAGDADKGKRPRTASGIHRMVGEAMADELEGSGLDDDQWNASAEQDRQATIRASSLGNVRDADVRSTSSSSDAKAAAPGWKDYLWNGTARRTNRHSGTSSIKSEHEHATDEEARPQARSGRTARRKRIDDDAIDAPTGATGMDDGDSTRDDASIAGSKSDTTRPSSISSWTLKLFAGHASSTRDGEDSSTARHQGPNGTVKMGKSSLHPERDANPSAKEALLKVSGHAVSKPKRRSLHQPLNIGAASMVKPSNHSIHSLPPGSPASLDSGTQLGPVEMDTILPHGTRPPTLTPSYHNLDDATDYLTDRFGFIYDQRRKKKELETFARLTAGKGLQSKEMLSSLKDSNDVDDREVPPRSITPVSIDERAEERPTKRWQDYLKIATFPTELLSHTPSSANIMTITSPAMKKSLVRSPTFGDGGFELPASTPNPLPLASSVTASHAELAKPFHDVAPASRRSSGDAEPVKLLLAQLTDLHDALQREKTVKWNEFLRKVRAERRKAGEMAVTLDARAKVAGMPETSLADGEVIGIATLGNKGKVGRAKYKEFKALVLAGIPVAHRAKIWAECSGASALRVPGYYEDLVANGVDDPIIISQIQMDINRTLTDNVFFRKGPGVAKLNEVLLAYSRRNAEVGYCQGMNLITASLLLIMPTAEDAFWVLVSIIEHMLPRHYFDHSLLTSRADQQVLRQYVTDLLPRLSAHLDALGIELEALTFQWFLSLFTDCLSAEALYRVWDVLLCCQDEDGHGGATFLFQVALALLKLNEPQLLACDSPAAVYAYLGGEITNHAISIDGLIRASEGLKMLVRRADVEDRRAKWVEVERDTIRERARIRSTVGAAAGDDSGPGPHEDMQDGEGR